MSRAGPDEGGQAQCHRFFFALMPDAAVADALHAFAQAQLDPAGLVPPARLHMTMALTGDYARADEAPLAALRQAGASMASAPFMLSLDRLTGWQAAQVLRPSAPPAALFALQAAIADAMAAARIPMREDWSFDPHVTLRRRGGALFDRPAAPFVWRADALHLVHSHAGLGRYEIAGRWPF